MSRFDEIREKFLEEAKGRTDSRSIYELRKKYLDRKAGEVNALMKEMRNIPKDEKADFGKNVNLLKDWVLGRAAAPLREREDRRDDPCG